MCLFGSNHAAWNSRFERYNIAPNLDNTVDLPSLNEVLIIYKEYGHMSIEKDASFQPIKHLATIKDLKVHLRKQNLPAMKTKKFPYLTETVLIDYLK